MIAIERYRTREIKRSREQFDRVPRTSRKFALELSPRDAYIIIFLDINMENDGFRGLLGIEKMVH